MKLITSTCILAFGIGFGAAWFLKPTLPSRIDPLKDDAKTQKDLKSFRTSTSAKSQLDQFENSHSKSELLAGFKSGDFQALMDEFKKKAGFSGLSSEEEKTLKSILAQWFKTYPSAALAWASGLQNTQDRREMMKTIIGLQLKSDLDATVAMIKQYREPDGSYIFPDIGDMKSDIIYKASERGEDYLIQFCKNFTSNQFGGGSFGTYRDGYNFEYVLNQLADIQQSLKNGDTLSRIPSNLLTEWVHRDPEAAWNWVQQGKALPANSYVDFFRGYAEVSTPEQVGKFLGDHFDPNQNSYDDTFSILLHGTSPSQSLSSFLDSISDQQNKVIDGIFTASIRSSGVDVDQLQMGLIQHMQPGQLEGILIRLQQEGELPDYVLSNLKQQLPKAGMSEEETQALLDAVKK